MDYPSFEAPGSSQQVETNGSGRHGYLPRVAIGNAITEYGNLSHDPRIQCAKSIYTADFYAIFFFVPILFNYLFFDPGIRTAS